MSWGDSFKSAWNNATDIAQHAAGAITTGVKETTSNAINWTKNKATETSNWVDKKTDEVVNLGKKKYTQISKTVNTSYQSGKKTFDNAYVATSTFVCDKALAIENTVYKEAGGRVTSKVGTIWFSPENVKVHYTEENFSKWTGGLSKAETQALYKADTGKDISDETINTLFTDPEKAKKILIKDKDIHTIYRDILNRNHPTTLAGLENNPKWTESSIGASLLHGSITRRNRKFVSTDGYREVIISPDGSVDNRNELKGTFNFFSPNDYPGSHITADVDPYIEHGN